MVIILENIPVVVLFIITLSANFSGKLLKTVYSHRFAGDNSGYHLYNAAVSLICGIFIIIISGGRVSCSPFTLLLGIIFGLVTVLQQVTDSAALAIGPLSYTSVIVSLSTVITALSGVIIFGESLRITAVIGMALMVLCIVFSVKKDNGNQGTSPRWLILSLIACASTGCIGILQKIHQSSSYREKLVSFLAISFTFSFCFSLLVLVFGKKKGKKPIERKSFPIISGIFIAAGICAALNNLINLFLSGVVDSMTLFPLLNGSGLILATVASVVIFKERLSRRQWFGLVIGVAATILLCI